MIVNETVKINKLVAKKIQKKYQDNSLKKYKQDFHFLSVLSVFKNESHIFEEWITHYLNEGVDHFYLIDNGSTDEYLDILYKYFDKISLIKNVHPNPQPACYTALIPNIQSEWTLICDLDEFIYSKNGYDTIKDFLYDKGYADGEIEGKQDRRKIWTSNTIGQIIIPSVDFISDGIIKQPKSVIQGFTQRIADVGKQLRFTLTKSIICTSIINNIIECGVHNHTVMGRTVNGNLTKSLQYPHNLKATEVFRSADNKLLNETYLKCNHYRFQSKEYFFNIKEKRGDVCFDDKSQRDIDYWKHCWKAGHTKKTVEDLELANKKYK
ncbi:MAG: hypothetical protein CL723_03165 [Chloroflexi bacterium]|nr:hypothetical protein [Chloroflexota bacterium]